MKKIPDIRLIGKAKDHITGIQTHIATNVGRIDRRNWTLSIPLPTIKWTRVSVISVCAVLAHGSCSSPLGKPIYRENLWPLYRECRWISRGQVKLHNRSLKKITHWLHISPSIFDLFARIVSRGIGSEPIKCKYLAKQQSSYLFLAWSSRAKPTRFMPKKMPVEDLELVKAKPFNKCPNWPLSASLVRNMFL